MPRPATSLLADEAAAIAAIDESLGVISRSVGLLGAATPKDAHVERARLLADYARGQERLPRWTYHASVLDHVRALRDLDALEVHLRVLDGLALARLYRARVDEVRLEILAAAAVGSALFTELARARFAPSAEHEEAIVLSASWARAHDPEPEAETALDAAVPTTPSIASDDRHPRSLVSRLRAEVARRRLPFTVKTSRSMTALAAISGDTLWVAEGRVLTSLDVERTVVHEIEAHALPRTRARSLAIGLFAIGTAGGSDDQEGYALWLEDARGVSTAARKRELAARHTAVTLMGAGADFVSVVRELRRGAVPLESALLVAERAFRGSHGESPGLGRERVYLEALVRVRRRLESRPDDEVVLGAGQVAVAAIDVLRQWVSSA